MCRIPLLAAVLALAGPVDVLSAGTAPGVELRDAELVAGDSPVLRNGAGTVRLEDTRLGRLGPPVFVPEPEALCSWVRGSDSRRSARSAADAAAPPAFDLVETTNEAPSDSSNRSERP